MVGIGILRVGVCVAVAVSCINKHPVGWQSIVGRSTQNTDEARDLTFCMCA